MTKKTKELSPREQYHKITGFQAAKNGRLTAQYVVWLEIIAKEHFKDNDHILNTETSSDNQKL